MKTDMQAMILSYLFLFIDTKVNHNFGAGDLVTAELLTALNDANKGKVYGEIHKLITDIYNDLTNGTLPAFASKIQFFYSRPKEQESESFFKNVNKWKTNKMEDFKNNLHPISLKNYQFLWYKYIKGESRVIVICKSIAEDSCKSPDRYRVANTASDLGFFHSIMKNKTKGILLEGDIFSPPCMDDIIIKTFKLENVCKFTKDISAKPLTLLGMLKYNKQSPVFVEQDNEYNFIFASKNHSLKKFG